MVYLLYTCDAGSRPNVMSRVQRIQVCCETLRRDLENMNSGKINTLLGHLAAAIKNFLANIRWRYLDPNGPKLGKVTKKEPLMHRSVHTFALPKLTNPLLNPQLSPKIVFKIKICKF